MASIQELFAAADGSDNNNAGYLSSGTHTVTIDMVDITKNKHVIRFVASNGKSASITYKSKLIACLKVGLRKGSVLADQPTAEAAAASLKPNRKCQIVINPVKGDDKVVRHFVQSVKPA